MGSTKEEKIKNKIKNGTKIKVFCFGKEQYLKYARKKYRFPRHQFSKFVFMDIDGNILEFLLKEMIINIHKLKQDNIYEISYSKVEHKYIFNRIEEEFDTENLEGLINQIRTNNAFWTTGKDIEYECKFEKDIAITNRMGEFILLFAVLAFILNKFNFIGYFMIIDVVYYFGQRYAIWKNLLKLYKKREL